LSTIPIKWRIWGRTFRVERGASGRWSAVGRAPGLAAYALDKLGDEATESAMQVRLDHWGVTNGARRVMPPVESANQQQILAV
jgi:hypothetical protein